MKILHFMILVTIFCVSFAPESKSDSSRLDIHLDQNISSSSIFGEYTRKIKRFRNNEITIKFILENNQYENAVPLSFIQNFITRLRQHSGITAEQSSEDTADIVLVIYEDIESIFQNKHILDVLGEEFDVRKIGSKEFQYIKIDHNKNIIDKCAIAINKSVSTIELELSLTGYISMCLGYGSTDIKDIGLNSLFSGSSYFTLLDFLTLKALYSNVAGNDISKALLKRDIIEMHSKLELKE